MKRIQLAAAALLMVAACGGGGLDAPACADGEVAVRAELGDQVIEDSRGGYTSYGFINAFGDNLGTLTIGFGDGSSLGLEWEELVANGDSVPARGALAFGGELDVGMCETGPFSGTLEMDDDGDGGRFQLVDLRSAPYCTGLAVSGTVTGCFRSQP